MKVSDDYVRRLLDSEDASESMARLVQFWSRRIQQDTTEPRFGLSVVEFNAHLVVLYDSEVGNGGHAQFFANPAGRFVSSLGAALVEIGLSEIRDILLRACSVFPGGNPPWRDDERNAIIDDLDSASFGLWGELDREYYSINRRIDMALLEYLRKMERDVLKEERAP